MSNDRKIAPPKHGPMKGVGDKAKDFKSAIKRLFKELNSFKISIFISLTLAALGAVLSIISPNKLKDLTNEISKGLIINTKNMETLNKEMKKNMGSDITVDGVTITSKDQMGYIMTMKGLSKDSKI